MNLVERKILFDKLVLSKMINEIKKYLKDYNNK